jgi:hypothetical protein
VSSCAASRTPPAAAADSGRPASIWPHCPGAPRTLPRCPVPRGHLQGFRTGRRRRRTPTVRRCGQRMRLADTGSPQACPALWTPATAAGARGHCGSGLLDCRQRNRPLPLACPAGNGTPRCGSGQHRHGQTARSVAWCSASIWSAPDGSGLLMLDGPSIQMGPDGSRPIVWMINGMIKRPGLQTTRPAQQERPAAEDPILIRDRRPSAVLSGISPGRTAPQMPQGWSQSWGRPIPASHPTMQGWLVAIRKAAVVEASSASHRRSRCSRPSSRQPAAAGHHQPSRSSLAWKVVATARLPRPRLSALL